MYYTIVQRDGNITVVSNYFVDCRLLFFQRKFAPRERVGRKELHGGSHSVPARKLDECKYSTVSKYSIEVLERTSDTIEFVKFCEAACPRGSVLRHSALVSRLSVGYLLIAESNTNNININTNQHQPTPSN